MKNNTLSHLTEMRWITIKCLLSIALIFSILLLFKQQVFSFVTNPLLAHMQHTFIATGITSVFIEPLKLSLVLSFIISLPFCSYQLWRFVMPALYQKERGRFLLLILLSPCLFYAGIAFCYTVVAPIAIDFFVQATPDEVYFMPDIHNAINFMITLSLAFGLVFQTPIVVNILLSKDILTKERLKKNRGVVIIACFTIGMLITPPDIISQTLIAIPMWLLFELGILLNH